MIDDIKFKDEDRLLNSHLKNIGRAILLLYRDNVRIENLVHDGVQSYLVDQLLNLLETYGLSVEKYGENTIKLDLHKSNLVIAHRLITDSKQGPNYRKNTARYPSYGNSDTE